MKYLIAVFVLSTSLAQAQFIKNTGIQIVNTANLTVNGDWVNDTGTSIKNDGMITTSDSWTNNGVLDATSTGGFVLNFSTDKTFTPGGSSFGFLQKEGIGNARITGQFSVKDSLSIKGGIITPLTSTDILTVAKTATVVSTPGSFLEGGNLVRQGTGNLFFPVGKGGKSLPITFLNVTGTNPSISVTLADAPTGYTAGAGINILIDFPYIWKATKLNVSDTASFVEIEYPNTLPVPTDVVVVRKLTGETKYEGMGARSVTNSGGIVKVRSYSRGLQGTYTIARGFAGNLATDKAVLETFYNATEGAASWTNDNQWLSADVTTWAGVTETGGYITALNLPGNKIKGSMPINFSDIAGLTSINLSGNELTSIPDLTSLTALTSLNVSNNKLDFGSLEVNATIPGINYANQALIGVAKSDSIYVGQPHSIKLTTGGTVNQYKWKKNDVDLSGSITDQYDIAAMSRSNTGIYTLEVTNPLVPGLTLKSAAQRATAVADLSGKLLVSATEPVTKGKLKLLKINPVGVAYTNTKTVGVTTQGTYLLDKIALDDYILLAQADTIAYKNYFPTYFDGSVFWEQATPIVLNENRSDVNIILTSIPALPKGEGQIAGIFEEEIPGGRVEGRGRISGASATVRRQQATGKPGKVMAEEIVELVYTNENGVFEFDKLEEGSYLINIQYPGVPMDDKSDVAITIGSKAKKENVQKVEAVAIGGKIVVTRFLIVGVSEEDQAHIQIYPNPVTTDLYITLTEGAGTGEMKLFDASGKEILSQHLPEGKSTTDLSQLTRGVYILKVMKKGNEVSIAKIVVE